MEHDTAHDRLHERLIEFAAGLLTGDERLDVERHLETCAACREELADWRAIGGGLAALDEGIPADMGAVGGWGRLNAALSAQSSTTATVAPAPDSDGARGSSGIFDASDTGETAAFRTAATLNRWASRTPLRGRISGVTAVAAALLIAVLGAAIFGAFGSGHGKTGSATPTAPIATPSATPESPTPSPSPTQAPLQASACPASATTYSGASGVYMESLTMLSATEGWDAVLGAPPLHFTDCHWTPDTSASNLTAISMLSATDGWAVAYDVGRPIYHYIDGQWVRQPLVGPNDGSFYMGIRMESPTDGWIIGSLPKDAESHYVYYALHYDGATWSRTTLPIGAFFDIAAVGPLEAWIAGADADGNSVLVHDVAGSFTTYKETTGGSFHSFQVNSPTDIWLVGWYPNGADFLESSGIFVLHYDGSSWQRVQMSDDPSIQQGKGFAIFSASDAWAFPAQLSRLSITAINGARRLTPVGWQTVAWPFTNIVGVDHMVKVGPDEYWAIGNVWPDLQSTGGAENAYSVLLHYADGQWTEYGS